jgi:transcriptional regulator with XRE-family HTH domain
VIFLINLKKIRKNKNLKQQDIAEIISVKQNTVSQYENGIRKLDSEQIIKLTKALEVSADYFLGLIDEDKNKDND